MPLNTIQNTTALLFAANARRGGERKHVRKEQLDILLSYIQVHCETDGLTANEITRVIEVIVSNKIQPTVSWCKSIFTAMVPKEQIQEECIIKLLFHVLHIFNSSKSSTSIKATLCLQWVIAVLEYNHVESTDRIHCTYGVWFSYLDSAQTVLVSRLLLYLTRSKDVSEYNVRIVRKMCQKNGSKYCVQAILGHFKQLRPDLVPQNVVAVNRRRAFWNLPNAMVEALNKVHARHPLLDAGSTWKQLDRLFGVEMEIMENYEPAPKKARLNSTVMLEFCDISAELYHRRKLKVPILSNSSWEELISNIPHLEMPGRLTALLCCGIKAFPLFSLNTDRNILLRLNREVYCVLTRELVYDKSPPNCINLLKFVNRVSEFENYIEEGLPGVFHFLQQYLVIWNGSHIFHNILRFITRMPLQPYKQMYNSVLKIVKKVFQVGTVEQQCTIIQSLTVMITNMMTVEFSRCVGQSNSFFTIERSTRPQLDIVRLFMYIHKVISIGLRENRNHCLLQQTCFNLCQKISMLQGQIHLPTVFLMPKILLYVAVFSSNGAFLSQACDLLSSYKRLFRIAERKQNSLSFLVNHYEDQKNMINSFVSDVVQLLWNGTAFSKREDSQLLKYVNPSIEFHVGEFIAVDVALHFIEHPALLFYIRCVKTIALQRKLDESETAILYNRTIVKHFPGIVGFLKKYVTIA